MSASTLPGIGQQHRDVGEGRERREAHAPPGALPPGRRLGGPRRRVPLPRDRRGPRRHGRHRRIREPAPRPVRGRRGGGDTPPDRSRNACPPKEPPAGPGPRCPAGRPRRVSARPRSPRSGAGARKAVGPAARNLQPARRYSKPPGCFQAPSDQRVVTWRGRSGALRRPRPRRWLRAHVAPCSTEVPPSAPGDVAVLTRRSRVTRFVILFPGRVGSTYLVSALDARPDVNAKGERLDPLRSDGADGPARLDPALPARPVPEPVPGGRVQDQAARRARPGSGSPPSCAISTRGWCSWTDATTSSTRSAASPRERLKDRTGRWNRYERPDDPGTPRRGDRRSRRLRGAPARRSRRRRRRIADYVAGLGAPPPARRLRGPPRRARRPTFGELLAFLGLTPGALEGATLKNTSDDLREAVANFDELRARYVGTRYEAMFDEVLVTRP